MTLKELRLEKKMTQAEVAKRVGVEPPAVSNWDIGKAIPCKKNRVKLARIYHVPLKVIEEVCGKAVTE